VHVDERTEGRNRICAGGRESGHVDGYVAAVIVEQTKRQARHGHEAYRDEGLTCGHRCPANHSGRKSGTEAETSHRSDQSQESGGA
jgi:hypothetical protein